MGYDGETPIPALKGRVCGFKNQINDGGVVHEPSEIARVRALLAAERK